MTDRHGLLEETAEDLFENAPCGYLTTRLDGTILKVNRTFESWTGLSRDDLLGERRFQDLLSPGGRIYHETHYAPLLQMQGSVREIAVELVRVDGSRLPALINSVLRRDDSGQPQVIRTTVFDATDRRRYEQELLLARRREQEIAQQLQRSLLSGTMPEAPELDLDFVYRPGVRGLEVGGDWYDAFWLDDGATLGLVIGDVVGRGINAAATMGQLRSAVRALASTGLPPGRLLEALDGYAHRHEVGRMATVVYARLALGSGRLEYACAGHPPPALAAPGKESSFLWEGRSLPLDAHARRCQPREEAAYDITPGSVILFYTDGLVELTTRPIAEGMDRLLEEFDLLMRSETKPLADPLVHAMHAQEPIDDVCVLSVRVGSRTQRRPHPAR